VLYRHLGAATVEEMTLPDPSSNVQYVALLVQDPVISGRAHPNHSNMPLFTKLCRFCSRSKDIYEMDDGELPGEAHGGVKPLDAHWLTSRRRIICLAAPKGR
jgi:hypothetical protein